MNTAKQTGRFSGLMRGSLNRRRTRVYAFESQFRLEFSFRIATLLVPRADDAAVAPSRVRLKGKGTSRCPMSVLRGHSKDLPNR